MVFGSNPVDGDEKLAVNGVEVCEVNPGADTYDVRRLLLAETRVGVFHISSYAWKEAYQQTCQKWLGFVASCVEHQCDFLTGDGNLFAQRSFKNDEHSDFRTSIMIDIIERFLQQINLHRSPMNRITYNVVSSTAAAEYLRSMHGEDADCDSMVFISLRQKRAWAEPVGSIQWKVPEMFIERCFTHICTCYSVPKYLYIYICTYIYIYISHFDVISLYVLTCISSSEY